MNKEIPIKNENILNTTEDFIAHQCNCITITSAGLAKTIAKEFPYADIYSKRKADPKHVNRSIENDRNVPGTIKIILPPNSDEKNKNIICMFGQWAPGKSNKGYDIELNRIGWFKSCLEQINLNKEKYNISSIAFPWKIGCGLAGGNWTIYQKIIENFQQDSGIKCVFYKL